MNIEISTERLHMDIEAMREQVENLRTAKDRVFQCLETLNTMWDGTANSVFMAQTGIDSLMLQGLIQNLNHLIECMEYAKTEYDKCSEDVSDKIASLRLSGDT